MSIIEAGLVRLTANRFAQRILEKAVARAQFLMGIGGGTGVETSGESGVLRLLRQKIAPPYTIFDVGANQGAYLKLVLSALRGTELVVHCFEPGSAAFGLLKTNLDSGERSRVRLNNFALGSEKGELTLFFDRPGSTKASLTKRRLDHFGIEFASSEKVNSATLDDYCRENAIQKIDLLKCDVEGHEFDVLMGAAAMFQKKAIGLVAFEFGGCDIDTRCFFQDFWYFFKDAGLDLFRVTPSGFLQPIASYRERDEQFRTTNFLAVLKR